MVEIFLHPGLESLKIVRFWKEKPWKRVPVPKIHGDKRFDDCFALFQFNRKSRVRAK